MKRMKKKLVAFVLFIMTAVCLTGCSNDAAMIVNGEEVPQSVVDYYMTTMSASLSSYGIDTETEEGAQYLPLIEEQTVSTCEQFALVRAGAKERGLEVTQEAVDAQFEKDKQSFESEEAYQEFLETNGITEESIKWIIESQLYYQELFNDLNKDVTATDTELKAAYDENPAAFDTVKVSYILIQPTDTSDDAAWAEAEAEANEVLSQLNEGGDFAALAQEHSDDTSTKENGGVLETPFTAESEEFVPEFVTAAVGLTEEGSYTTEPVRSDSYGYFIIKLDEKVTGWENLKEEIEESLLGPEKDENFTNFMDEMMANIVYDKEYTYQYTTEDTSADGTATEEDATTEDTATEGTSDENAAADETTADDAAAEENAQ